jgi:CheY-like chemotaxis protein
MLKLVLCIDDDPIALMLLKKTIDKAQFSNKTITSKNGEEALLYLNSLDNLKAKKNQPELIFLDLNMPVMGGWDFLDIYDSQKHPNINSKIIILSSTTDPKDLEKAKKHPIVVDFLSKPLTIEMLESIKNKHLSTQLQNNIRNSDDTFNKNYSNF